jgi:TRAP transporter TAXI family solute receptor
LIELDHDARARSRRGSLWLVVCTLIASVSCGGETAPTGSQFLSIGSAPPGGAFFVVGGAIAETLTTHGGGRWEVTSEATKGTLESIRRLDRGELELGLANSSISYFAIRGEGGWDKAYRMRSLMTLAHNVLVFVTPHSSGIETLEDLAGKRVVVGVAGAGWEYFIRPILAAHSLSYDDFTPLNNTQAGAVDMLADGSADAAFLGGAVPTASIVQATTAADTLLIPFDEEPRLRLVEDYPFYFNVPIPAGTYRGQDQEFAGLNCGSMHIIVHEDIDEELAYEITRTIYENGASVAEKHPAGEFIRADNVARDNGTPFHPGAIRFYREMGIWPADADATK